MVISTRRSKRNQQNDTMASVVDDKENLSNSNKKKAPQAKLGSQKKVGDKATRFKKGCGGKNGVSVVSEENEVLHLEKGSHTDNINLPDASEVVTEKLVSPPVEISDTEDEPSQKAEVFLSKQTSSPLSAVIELGEGDEEDEKSEEDSQGENLGGKWMGVQEDDSVDLNGLGKNGPTVWTSDDEIQESSDEHKDKTEDEDEESMKSDGASDVSKNLEIEEPEFYNFASDDVLTDSEDEDEDDQVARSANFLSNNFNAELIQGVFGKDFKPEASNNKSESGRPKKQQVGQPATRLAHLHGEIRMRKICDWMKSAEDVAKMSQPHDSIKAKWDKEKKPKRWPQIVTGNVLIDPYNPQPQGLRYESKLSDYTKGGVNAYFHFHDEGHFQLFKATMAHLVQNDFKSSPMVQVTVGFEGVEELTKIQPPGYFKKPNAESLKKKKKLQRKANLSAFSSPGISRTKATRQPFGFQAHVSSAPMTPAGRQINRQGKGKDPTPARQGATTRVVDPPSTPTVEIERQAFRGCDPPIPSSSPLEPASQNKDPVSHHLFLPQITETKSLRHQAKIFEINDLFAVIISAASERHGKEIKLVPKMVNKSAKTLKHVKLRIEYGQETVGPGDPVTIQAKGQVHQQMKLTKPKGTNSPLELKFSLWLKGHDGKKIKKVKTHSLPAGF